MPRDALNRTLVARKRQGLNHKQLLEFWSMLQQLVQLLAVPIRARGMRLAARWRLGKVGG
jgi:hypothetical protein